VNRTELAELSAANRFTRELKTEVATLKRTRELLRESPDPKGVTRP
jgi:transposase